MMRWLISTALQLRIIVVALMFVLLYVGYNRLSNTPMDVFPEFAPPYVEIQTEAPGLSTPEVEALVTIPLENALNGTPQMQKLRSKSVLGLSSVVLYFEKGIDVMEARQHVQERLSRAAATLPAVAHPPVMLSPLSSTSRILKVGVTSKKLSQMDMTTIIRWDVRPRLMAIPGVANVAIWGQRDKQYQILLNPERLRLQNLTIADVQKATSNALKLAGGGFMDTPNQRMAIANTQSISGTSELANIPVATHNGNIIRLSDVAEVSIGNPPPIGDAIINNGPGLLLIVEKQPGANTLDVTYKVEAALTAIKPGLPDLEFDSTIFRPASFIEMSLEHLNISLLIGCLLIVLVLGFFLYDWRTALISVTALPCSLVGAALVLHYAGRTLDTMVLAGLIIALGEVVDDAIIDVENISRRLRLNRLSQHPEPAFKVVLNASMEMRSAVIYGSLIVVLVLLPVFMLPGLAGSFFQPLALSYIVAIMVSLLIALTLTPALSLLLLPKSLLREKEPPVAKWLKEKYRSILPAMLVHPKRVVSTLSIILASSALVVPFLGQEFLPHFKEYDFLMHWVEKPGTSLEAMKRITVEVSKDLRQIEGVRNFGAHIGRAEVADEVVGPNFTELWISVDPEVPDYDATVAKIQETVDGYPGLFRDVLTYLRERIKEVLTGTSASIVVRLYGPDLDKLYQKATEMGNQIQEVDGVADLKVQQQTLVPQIQVNFKPAAVLQFGVSPGDVSQTVSTLMRGTKVGEVYQEQKIFDVVIWGEPAIRSDINAFRNLMVDVPNGGKVPLRDLADILIVPAPNEITRENSSRRIDVTCNVKGRDLGSVAQDIEAKISNMTFEAGYHPELLGEYAEQQQSSNTLLSVSLLSLLGIFLVLYADFKSFRLSGFVIGSLLFALTGCVIAALLTGGILSLGSLVGFITVLGVAARNTIMMISHYQFLETQEGVPFGPDLILQGAQERIMPIIMTALTSVLALLPVILTGNRSGQEIEYPMAVVIVGGVITSTLLNLLFVPTIYYHWGTKK